MSCVAWSTQVGESGVMGKFFLNKNIMSTFYQVMGVKGMHSDVCHIVIASTTDKEYAEAILAEYNQYIEEGYKKDAPCDIKYIASYNEERGEYNWFEFTHPKDVLSKDAYYDLYEKSMDFYYAHLCKTERYNTGYIKENHMIESYPSIKELIDVYKEY